MKISLDDGLIIISEYLKKLTGAIRCSIFVHDSKNKTLWTILANGMGKIVIEDNKGIVGQAFTYKKEIIENNVAENPYFFKEIDKNSGYQTMNMLVCPIFDLEIIL